MEEFPSIEVQGLSKSYGRVPAIHKLSFQVNKGEIVGFLGPNGAGKSTTMRILCGLIPGSSGSARICGLSIARQAESVKRCIGYMPENNPLPEAMRVREYLRFRGGLKEMPRRTLRRRIDEVLEICDLHYKTGRRVIGSLSKGFRQRVGVADTILAEPAVAIMDEPTIGLDPHQVLAFRDLIHSLRGKMTIILSSHILAEVERACDRVIILNQGRIVAQGTSEELRREFIRDSEYRFTLRGHGAGVAEAVRRVDPAARLSDPMPAGPGGDGAVAVRIESSRTSDMSESFLQAIEQVPGVHVQAFFRREPSLEDIFLAATRRSWKETEESLGRSTVRSVAADATARDL